MFFKAHTLYFTQTSLHQTLRAAGWHVVAHNPADDDNLLVLAQPTSSAAEAANTAWQPSRALVEAQQRRTWPTYLVDQFTSGRVIQKINKRQEEKRTVRGFEGARAVLDHLYMQPTCRPAEKANVTLAAWLSSIGALSATMTFHGLLEM
jgi:hypothetical protein